MSSISLRLPESLHKQARELAEREDISINQSSKVTRCRSASRPAP